jgi:hypothetical protein
MNDVHKVSIAATSVLAGATLTAVLFFTAVPRLQAEDLDRCQRESRMRNMNSTSQLRNTGATASRQITSLVNCTMRENVAAVSSISGGMNTSTLAQGSRLERARQ